jgi:hypothetical protein
MKTESPTMEHVPLPKLSEELLRSTSGTNMVWSDSRRFRRAPASASCILQSQPTFASAGHATVSQDVWLRDISRGGVRFIHGAQLFPGERSVLTLSTGVQLQLETVWCRRVEGILFVSGCHFVTDADPNTRTP